jgi:hypothetical protein
MNLFNTLIIFRDYCGVSVAEAVVVLEILNDHHLSEILHENFFGDNTNPRLQYSHLP